MRPGSQAGSPFPLVTYGPPNRTARLVNGRKSTDVAGLSLSGRRDSNSGHLAAPVSVRRWRGCARGCFSPEYHRFSVYCCAWRWVLGVAAVADALAYGLPTKANTFPGTLEFLCLFLLLVGIAIAAWAQRGNGAWPWLIGGCIPLAFAGMALVQYWPHGALLGIAVACCFLSWLPGSPDPSPPRHLQRPLPCVRTRASEDRTRSVDPVLTHEPHSSLTRTALRSSASDRAGAQLVIE